MLLSAIATRVQTELGDNGGVYIKPAYVVDWANEAVKDIFRKTNIGRSKTITATLSANTDVYVSVEEIFKVHFIVADGVKLEEMLYETILDQFGWEFVTTQGPPRFFWRGYDAGENKIYFAPKPTASVALTLSLVNFPDALLVTDDLNTILPSSYEEDVIRFCVMRAQERNKDFRASEKAEQQYNNNLSERVAESQKIDDDFASFAADPYDFI